MRAALFTALLLSFSIYMLDGQSVEESFEIGNTTECQAADAVVIEKSQGTLIFPHVGRAKYEPNCHFTVRINTKNVDNIVNLEFKSYDIERGDNLTISDEQFGGSFTRIFNESSQPNFPLILTNLKSIVTVEFFSDSTYEATGCSIKWFVGEITSTVPTTTNNGLPPGTVYRDLVPGEEGIFYSPNYPYPYPLSVTLHWVLTAPVNDTIYITFDDFDLSLDDSLTFYEGIEKVADNQRAKYTGERTKIPSPLQSVTNQMLVVFLSTNRVVKNGFKIKYKIYEPPVPTKKEVITTRAPSNKQPLTPEGRTVIIVLGCMALLTAVIIAVYFFYWRPKQKREEQRIATQLYDNGREPISVANIPNRPVTAVQAARLRAAAQMRREYTMAETAGALPSSMLERPMSGVRGPQRQGTSLQSPRKAAVQPEPQPVDVEEDVNSGWSQKLENRFSRTAAPTAPSGQTGKESLRKESLPPLDMDAANDENKIKKKKKKKRTKAGSDDSIDRIISSTSPGLRQSNTAPGELTGPSSKLPGYVLRQKEEDDWP